MKERLTTDSRKIFARESLTLNSMTKDELRKHYNEIFDRLQEYEVAEEQGQLIRLPCKVGDEVYYVSKYPSCLSVLANTIYEAEVVRIVTTNMGTSLVIQIHNDYGCTEIPNIHEWQQVVFPTREEAQAKLKEGGKE